MDEADVAHSADAARGRSPLLFSHAVFLNAILLAMILTSRISFHRLLEEFGIAWSPMTSFALGGFLPALLALVLVATVAKELVLATPKFKNLWNAIAIGVALACLLVYVLGIFSPLVDLTESLS